MHKIKALVIFNDAVINGASKSLDELLEILINEVDVMAVLPMHGPQEEVLERLHVPFRVVEFTCGYGRREEFTKLEAEKYIRNN